MAFYEVGGRKAGVQIKEVTIDILLEDWGRTLNDLARERYSDCLPMSIRLEMGPPVERSADFNAVYRPRILITVVGELRWEMSYCATQDIYVYSLETGEHDNSSAEDHKRLTALWTKSMTAYRRLVYRSAVSRLLMETDLVFADGPGDEAEYRYRYVWDEDGSVTPWADSTSALEEQGFLGGGARLERKLQVPVLDDAAWNEEAIWDED